MNEHAKILREHPVFSTLSSRILNRLTEHSSLLKMAKGSVVFREGETADALYLVLSGRCQAITLLADGSEQILGLQSPGDTIGEHALLTRDPHRATVRVATDATLLRLDGKDIWRMLEKTPRVASTLLERMRAHAPQLVDDDAQAHSKLGRVAALTSVSRSVSDHVLGANLAVALRAATGQNVLHVRVQTEAGETCLWDWAETHPLAGDDFRFATDVREAAGGVQSLSLCAGRSPGEAEAVAPLLGHLARHFRYVLVSVPPEARRPLLLAFHRQSDLSYLLFSQSGQSLYEANLLIRDLQQGGAATASQIRPLMCVGEQERIEDEERLATRLGAPVHAYLRNCPRVADERGTFYLKNPRHPIGQRLRGLAREIGRCRVGIALSSGGAKGLAHVGVLKVLEENDIDVDMIAGASMGAYVGALKAFGLGGDELVKLALAMEGRFGLLKIVDPAIPPRRGFIKGGKARRLIEQSIGDAHFSDLALPLRVVLTDLETLERVVCDVGQISPRVQASMAMPGIVLPVVLDGHIYVDGGVADPLPVDVLMELGIERIIAVNTIPNPEEMAYHAQVGREIAALSRKQRNLIPTLKHHLNYFEEGNILDIWMRSMHGLQTRVAEGSCRQADVVLRPVAPGAMWHDFANARHYIDLGRKAAEVELEALKELVKV